MKIKIGKVAAWIGRALLTAFVSEATERLSRPRGAVDRADDSAVRGDVK